MKLASRPIHQIFVYGSTDLCLLDKVKSPLNLWVTLRKCHGMNNISMMDYNYVHWRMRCMHVMAKWTGTQQNLLFQLPHSSFVVPKNPCTTHDEVLMVYHQLFVYYEGNFELKLTPWWPTLESVHGPHYGISSMSVWAHYHSCWVPVWYYAATR